MNDAYLEMAKNSHNPRTNPVMASDSQSDTTNTPSPLSASELAGLTDDDLKRMARDSLVLMIHGNKGDLRALGAIRELLDRLEGKPIQRQEIKQQIQTISFEADRELLKRARAKMLADKSLE